MEQQGNITYRNKQSVVSAYQYPTCSHIFCQHLNLKTRYGEQGMLSKSIYQARGKYGGNKGWFLKNVIRWWWWRLVLTLLHQRNAIKREKSSCGSSKTKRYSSRTLSTRRRNEDNTKWQDRKSFVASFWIGRSRPWLHLPRPAPRTLW